MNDIIDTSYIAMAYALAERARGWASPNPYVGAVFVRHGRIVGYGYHERSGGPHAEIIALERAGALSRGSTLYLTLEPCVHWGRTPPCADAVIRARPKRVVISSPDPNPLVYKRGIQKLRNAGIEVALGLLEQRNQRLNESYLKYITRAIPFVTLKAAISLDGRIATKAGDSRWISSPETREFVHLVRGEHDAIMVGINTILKDDPLLTIRHPHFKGKKIARIILDSELRLPLKARILTTLDEGTLTIFTGESVSPKKRAALTKRGAAIVSLPGRAKIPLPEVLRWLGGRQVSSVLVEGGSRLSTSFLEEGLADKILLTISPRLIGGEKALSFYEGRGICLVRESLPLRNISSFQIGDTMIMEGYF